MNDVCSITHELGIITKASEYDKKYNKISFKLLYYNYMNIHLCPALRIKPK